MSKQISRFSGSFVSVMNAITKGLPENQQKVLLLYREGDTDSYKTVGNVSEDTLKSICYCLIESVGNKTQTKQFQFLTRFAKQFEKAGISNQVYFSGRVKASSSFYDIHCRLDSVLEKVALSEILLNKQAEFENRACLLVKKLGVDSGKSTTLKAVPEFDLSAFVTENSAEAAEVPNM